VQETTLVQSKDILYAMALTALGLTIPATSALAGPPVASGKAAKAAVTGPAVITDVDIVTDETGTHITIIGDRPFTPDVKNFGRPAATVITINGKWGPGKGGTAKVGQGGVSTVRFGQFQAGQVRIVANTGTFLPFTAQSSADKRKWEIIVHAPGVPVGAVAATRVNPNAKPAAPGFIKPTPVIVEKTAPAQPTVQSAPVYATRVASTNSAPYSGMLKMPAAPKPKPVVPALPTQPVPLVANAAKADPVPAANTAPKPTAPAAVPLEGEEGRRVSLDFVAADINDVLKALSLQSGINIVTGNDVKGNITVSLKRVSMNEALDMVTRLSGYTYAQFGSAYVVGTPSSVGAITARSEKAVENVTEFIPYRFNSTSNVYRLLGDKFPGLKLPEADKNEPVGPKVLVLTDTPKRVEEVRAFVEKLEQVASIPTQGGVTEFYKVKYAAPSELITIVTRLVPTVSIQLGPTQSFQPNALGGSAAFTASAPQSPLGGGGAGGAGGGATGGPAGGASTGQAAAGSGASRPSAIPTMIVLTGAPTDIARAKEVLAQLDVRVPQIVYEAKVVDIGSTDLTQLGFRYDFSRPLSIGEANRGNGSTVGSSDTPPPARQPEFGAIFRSPYSIGITLDALMRNEKNRLLANPNLSALDGQPASVFIGDQIKYVINIQQTPQGQVIQTETATVGITLKVTGKASEDGTVTLYVHPEVSVISQFLDVGGGISLPQIATRFVDTTVRVKDGETFAIGGLMRESDIETIQKVPLLGDLPFFGNLFRHKNRTKANSNLVVFITTKIVKD
jgi:type II secretory pathway component GspD/PulD (secretin)